MCNKSTLELWYYVDSLAFSISSTVNIREETNSWSQEGEFCLILQNTSNLTVLSAIYVISTCKFVHTY